MIKERPTFRTAIKWSYSATWGERVIGAFVTFVLAAALGPKEFGVIALATVFVGFVQMFLDQGLIAALIQRRHLDPEHLDTVFWITLALSLFLMGMSVSLSPIWARANHTPQLSNVIRVLSLTIPIEGLTTVQVAVLKRELDFRSLAIRGNLSVVAGGTAGLLMAWGGLGAWALVGQQIVRDLTALGLLWRFSTWRPHFRISLAHLRELATFSVSNFLAQLAAFSNSQAPIVLLGLLAGSVPVGLYRLAERLMSTVLSSAASSIQAVALPEFSRLQDRPDELRNSVLACIRLSCLVTLPALAGLAAVSRPLAEVMGPRWIAASGTLSVLCAVGMTLVFVFFTGPLLQAFGRPLQSAGLEWARTLVTLFTFAAAGFLVRGADAESQATKIAMAQLFTGAVIVAPTYLLILCRTSKVTLFSVASTAAPSSIAAVVTFLAAALTGNCLSMINPVPTTVLVCQVATGGFAGLMTIVKLDAEVKSSILRYVNHLALIGRRLPTFKRRTESHR